MKITLDYEEYLELKEKADLNQKKIHKMRNELQEKYNKNLKEIKKEYEKYLTDEVKITIIDKINKIKKMCLINSILGFISLNKLFDIVDKVKLDEIN